MTRREPFVARPVSGPPRPYRFPEFRRRAVGGGEVLACHLPGRPLAAVTLVVDAGATVEPPGQEGVALLTARLLGEGTRSMDAYGFGVAVERLGADWSADADWDSLRVGLDVPAAGLPAAVELLAEAVHHPALGAEAFARLQAERLDELGVDRSQPRGRAMAAVRSGLWTPDSRYAASDGGEPGTVAGLGPAQVREFHAGSVLGAAAALVLAGDLSGVDVPGLAGRVLDGWPTARPAGPTPTVRPAAAERRVVVVHRPGAPQTMLVLAHPGPPRAIPDYVPLTTMALVFGGLFNSRLNYRLREVKGYTYGAFAGFDLRRHGGVFTVRAPVQTAVTGPAAHDAVTELTRMQQDGVSGEELAAARDYRAGVFPISFAQPHAVAWALADLVVHRLPDDYYVEVREQIATVPLDAVNQAAATRLSPAELLTVAVGDADQVAGPLGEAGLGPVRVVTDQPPPAG